MYEQIALEMAIVERLALDAVRRKIASQQLGEAWIGLTLPSANAPEDTAITGSGSPHTIFSDVEDHQCREA